MKRSIFAATLALTPTLLHAQAAKPAQTSSPAMLQAHYLPAADIKSAKDNTSSAAASHAAVRISTGVTAPHLDNFALSAGLSATRTAAVDTTVVVTLTVNADGTPSDVAIAKSAGQTLDNQVLAALRTAQFRPGTLDGQPFALPLRLNIVVPRGTQY